MRLSDRWTLHELYHREICRSRGEECHVLYVHIPLCVVGGQLIRNLISVTAKDQILKTIGKELVQVTRNAVKSGMLPHLSYFYIELTRSEGAMGNVTDTIRGGTVIVSESRVQRCGSSQTKLYYH
jgi:hypothetical protein